MNLLKLFLLAVLLAAVGVASGGAVGMNIGRGGLLLGGFIVGVLFVIACGFLGARWHWIERSQRLWAILGGGFGFMFAFMVALATIAVPYALLASTVLVGTGMVLVAVAGGGSRIQS